MSNIIAHRHLIHCVAVALALSTAFVIVSMPKPDTVTPSTTETLTSSATQTLTSSATQTLTPSTTDADAKAACHQAWPYYERSCIRESRQQGSNVHAVRVIAISGQAEHHVSRN
jgi:hypothetical protein